MESRNLGEKRSTIIFASSVGIHIIIIARRQLDGWILGIFIEMKEST